MVWKNPDWTLQKKRWLMALIEGMVSNPAAANFMTIYGEFDLEIGIVVAPEDEAIFDDTVCQALSVLVGRATDTLKPVIYLEKRPPETVGGMKPPLPPCRSQERPADPERHPEDQIQPHWKETVFEGEPHDPHPDAHWKTKVGLDE